jgi:hypothetical protein
MEAQFDESLAGRVSGYLFAVGIAAGVVLALVIAAPGLAGFVSGPLGWRWRAIAT